ncbi:MAG TPA: tetratricopeptide repeat protein [Pyrinomonadaceae bacterium]|nr:tetratricopeptide repeat protein [Pyrinomonadaceae bacterium]
MNRSFLLHKILSVFILFSFFTSTAPISRANDLVPSEDLTGGASVFVFRGSSKKPIGRSSKAFRSRAAGTRRSSARTNSQIATTQQRRAARSKAALAARQRARAAARIRQSDEAAIRGRSLLERQHYETAAAEFRTAIDLNPKNAEAAEGLSEALALKGIEVAGADLKEDALVYLNEAVVHDPSNAAAFAKLGEIHDAHGRSDEALANYEKAVELDATLTSLYLPMALAYLEKGDPAKSEAALAKAEGDGVDTTDFRNARLLNLVGQEKFDEALAMLDQAPATGPAAGEVEYQKAAIYDRMQKPGEAVAAYKRSIASAPANSDAWLDMGTIYYNQGDYDNALLAYQETVKLEPDNTEAHKNLASVYRQLMRYADANVHYRLAEPGYKSNPDLYSEWGYCLAKVNEWDKAIARLERARELSPEALDLNNVGWGLYNAARADIANNNKAAADQKLADGRVALQAAVEADPEFEAAHFNLGVTNNALGDFEAAVNALNRALSLRGDWVIALNQLGVAFRGSDDLATALTYFKRASTLDDSNLFGLYSLGEVYFLTGNKAEARKIRNRLNALDPTLASKLDNVLSGKIVLDEAKRNIRNKVPRLPGLPF